MQMIIMGKEAFKLLHDYLIAHAETADKMQMGMAGFILKNTVSENGTVTRGVCVVDENGMLEQIHETTGISIQADGVSLRQRRGSEVDHTRF